MLADEQEIKLLEYYQHEAPTMIETKYHIWEVPSQEIVPNILVVQCNPTSFFRLWIRLICNGNCIQPLAVFLTMSFSLLQAN